MLLPDPDPSANDPLAEWRLVPRMRRDHSPEELASFRERIVVALRVGHSLGIHFELGIDSGPASNVALRCWTPESARWCARTFTAAYRGASWTLQTPTQPEAEGVRYSGRRVREWPQPLREASDGPTALNCLAASFASLRPGVRLRWRLSPFPAKWGHRPEPDVGSEPPREAVLAARRGMPWTSAHRSSPPPTVGAYPLFWKSSAILFIPPELARGPGWTRTRSAVETPLRSGRGNGVRFSRRRGVFPLRTPTFPIAEDELALLLPTPDISTRSFEGTRDNPSPQLPLGRAVSGQTVGLPIEAGQGRHLAILGETGMGKSSTLVAIAHAASRLGGVILFDPLGETAHSFLAGVPDTERARVLWVTPQRPSNGINALEGIGGIEHDPVLADRRLNDIVHALRRVRSGRFEDSAFWGPRLEEMLTRAIVAAAAFADGTLADAHTLLETRGRTVRVVPPEAQEPVRELSQRIRDRPDDAEGARRLLYEVVRSPVLSRMLCARTPELHVRDLVTADRIAVISGDASEVGETAARYLLAVYLALVWSELLARRSNPKTFVVLDESQWFSHESLAEMLRLARRRNVHVMLATQTVASLPEAVAEAVWTNVSDVIAFRGSAAEARELSRTTTGVSVEDLMALPRGHAAVLLGKGNRVEWLRTAGRPPPSDEMRNEIHGGNSPPIQDTAPDSAPTSPPPPSIEKVLAWIRARASALPKGSMLRVDLAELRKSVDPQGETLRSVGALLGRLGAIVVKDRSQDHTVWVVDPSRLPAA